MSLGKRSGKREMLRVYILYMYIMYIYTAHENERQADVGFSRKSNLFARIVKELSIHVHCM